MIVDPKRPNPYKTKTNQTQAKSDAKLTAKVKYVEEAELVMEQIRYGRNMYEIANELGMEVRAVRRILRRELKYLTRNLAEHAEAVHLKNFSRTNFLYGLCEDRLKSDLLDGKETDMRVVKTALEVIKVENSMVIGMNGHRTVDEKDKKRLDEDDDFVITLNSSNPLARLAQEQMSEAYMAEGEDVVAASSPSMCNTLADLDDIQLTTLLIAQSKDSEDQEETPDLAARINVETVGELESKLRELKDAIPVSTVLGDDDD